MTDNPKNNLIIESSDQSSILSERNEVPETESNTDNITLTSLPIELINEKSSVKSLHDNTSSSIPSTSIPSSSIPSSSIPSSSIPSSVSTPSIFDSTNFANNLESEFKGLNCNNDNFFEPECNKFILKKELIERNYLSENEDTNDYLYPNLNDTSFNIKIATKKEFNDTKYEGPDFTKSIKEQADILANADFELQPHQAFVKNFMSFQTPYSSLLLFHGLGSGKTCSAIGVCEEMRDYMKQMGINKRIIIVASENVQDNFKLQLFDERKLKQVNGIWSMRGCIGNKLLKEINPMNMPMPKEKVVSQIKNLINTYYIFLGYVQFANYIIKTMNYEEEIKRKKESKQFKQGENREKTKIQMLKDVKIDLNARVIRRLRNEFNNRLIVIDEVHNIRKTEDNDNKKVAINIEYLIKAAENMRFLLLSATPMYNNYKEIVWLLNLMNTNDRRGRVDVRDIFDKNGNFKKNGEELLTRKATGYVSFVRGENPYTFPYRVYPTEFAPEKTFPEIKYPSHQMNLKPIDPDEKSKKRILSLYLTKIGECSNCGRCQYCCYKYIIYNLRNKRFTITTKYGVTREMPSFENMESFGYTLLQTPLESLIISYPIPGLKNILDEIPEEKLSNEVAERFDRLNPKEEDDQEDENPEPIISTKQPLLIVESSSSERKSASEEDEPEDVEEYNKEVYEQNSIKDIEQKKSFEKNTEKPVKKQSFNIGKSMIIEISDSNSDKTMVPTVSDKTMVPTGSDKTMVPTETTSEPNIEVIPRSHQGIVTSGGENISSSSKLNDSLSIDPHQLTGKIGLERMMDFLDSKSPPIKGEFEYKNSTLKNYGKIFTRNEIGNYSSKIKNLLENIYNSETEKISDGVILVYSQYIDSGLIPVALALEEMGFTRYGQTGIKPLFKNRPTEVVDVRTMKIPTDKKNFMPARYSMITGDTRLSPNNEFEVKGLTGEDNKDGNKVKVVLISKAGSEGIDFKFIRQIHILEPWYNMNRIEQIIGRGVRNFSHKDLPFEKRNVQIFMYGTILDKNIEESADLYVYRVAEYKALQIGKVTRVLKETAVDCIINHDQTNFTQEIMSANLKEPIVQELSNGVILRNFKVGDAPFSPACDYMADCNYNCRPNASIDESKLNEDTYDENFIVMNSEKILQRIRMLFKESFFYKKDRLLRSIRTPKEYPYVQIYSALTQLIEDENEFIVDKYGRNGRLINIGDYYLFQPIELKDKNISIFDRSVPLDFKHDSIKFEVKQDIVKQVIDKRNLKKINVEDDNELKIPEGKQIIDEMILNLNTSKEFSKQTKVPRGDDDWYKHYGIVMRKMAKEYPDSKPYLISFLVAHMIELLLFDDKINMMNYLFSLQSIKKDSFEWFAKEYFDRNIITAKSLLVFIAYKLNKRMIMILNENNRWVEATPEDQREIASTKDVKEFLRFNPSDYSKVVGFIGYENNNKYLVFKTKDTTSKRDTGARCDQATKSKNLAKLNEIVGEEKYTNQTTKAVKDEHGNIISEAVGNTELCVLEEVILRYYNETSENGKKWFFTPEMAIYHKLYTVFV
jgi:hypothetical protein